MLPPSIEKLIAHLRTLPGVGPRQAARFAFSLLRRPADELIDLGETVARLPDSVRRCQLCRRLMEARDGSLCSICDDPHRDANALCVVVSDADVAPLEETGAFRGRFFVLGGTIDLVDESKNPTDAVNELLKRIAQEQPQEIVLAMDATTEGDQTAMELASRIRAANTGAAVTRLGRGLSTGGEIEYMDPDTLRNALERRVP